MSYLIPNTPYNDIVTYILQCEDECWYIGIVKNGRANKHLQNHLAYGVSGWTKVHKPIKVHAVVPGNHEKEFTMQYRELYGKDKVRGYIWSKCDNPDFECYKEPEKQAIDVVALFQC